MSELEQGVVEAGQVRLDGGEALPDWELPCLARELPGVGVVWVHGYTEGDRRKWMGAARALAGQADPGVEHLLVAQAAWVCRTAPHGPHHTFRLPLAGAEEAFRRLLAWLPGAWLEQACADSDRLMLEVYLGEAAAMASAQGDEHAG